MKEKDIQIKIQNRKEQIIQELKLFSIKLPLPRAMTKCDIDLKLERYRLLFYLISYRIDDTLSDVRIGIKGQHKSWSNYRQKISLFDLVNLIAYLEEYVEIAQKKVSFETFIFSVYNAEKSHVFSLQSRPVKITQEKKGFLELHLKLKNVVDFSEEDLDREEDLDVEIESPVSFENILNFTSSVREFLVEAYVKDELTVKPSESLFADDRGYYIAPALTNSGANKDEIDFTFSRLYDLPIEKCKGIEGWDTNIRYILVQASVECVAQAFHNLHSMDVWIPDTYGNEIEIQPESILVFRFQGHSWSTIYEANRIQVTTSTPTEEDAQKISKLLNTRAIFYSRSDTCSFVTYEFFEGGVLQEKLLVDNDLVLEFESKLRSLALEDIDSYYALTRDFFVRQDAYIPYIYSRNYFVIGKKRILRMNNLLANEVDRMDYLAKKRSKSNNSGRVLVGKGAIL